MGFGVMDLCSDLGLDWSLGWVRFGFFVVSEAQTNGKKKEIVKIKTHLRKRLWEIRCWSMENLTHIYMSTYSGIHKYQRPVIRFLINILLCKEKEYFRDFLWIFYKGFCSLHYRLIIHIY